MPTAVRRVIASITAAVMLVTSVNCVCGDGELLLATTPDRKHSCCAGDLPTPGLPPGEPQQQHDPSCKHCQPALAEAKSTDQAPAWMRLITLETSLSSSCASNFMPVTRWAWGPLLPRPPIADATLLGLGCALIL